MRVRRRNKNHEPSLVPLADMLTNTVGIMLFILAFTLLATGGATLPKRLPMEHPTKASPIHFVCVKDRLLPLDEDLVLKLPRPAGVLANSTEINDYIRRANGAEIEDAYFKARKKVTYENGDFRSSVEFIPKPGAGFTLEDLKNPHGPFAKILQQNNPKDVYLLFHLNQDGLEIFKKARAIAAEKTFGATWEGYGRDEHVIVSLSGGGDSGPDVQPIPL